jgi:hypothetical protein
MRAIIAMAMPVLPDDGSMIVRPGVRVPSASASSIIFSAMRSFTDPAGFCPSIFPRIRTFGFGLSTETSIIGVLPIISSTEEYTAMGTFRGIRATRAQERWAGADRIRGAAIR